MKKIIIGALVGGIILFIWQTLSWTVLNLHDKALGYTPKQDSIMAYLNSQFTESGQYYMPRVPNNAGSEERDAWMKSADGKPWAIISYHTSLNTNMVPNIIRNALIDIVLMALFCWIISKFTTTSFGTVLLSSLFAGLIVFMNGVYTQHIWYHTFDLMSHLTDALVGWGAAGLWLGWWFSKKK